MHKSIRSLAALTLCTMAILFLAACSGGDSADDGLPAEAKPLKDVAVHFITDMLSGNEQAAQGDLDMQDIEGNRTDALKSLAPHGTLSGIEFGFYNKPTDHPEDVRASVGGMITMSDKSQTKFMADENFRNNKWVISQFTLMPQ